MKKVVVLENISRLDDDMSAYLHSIEGSHSIQIVYSLVSKSSEKKLEIDNALSKAETLCISSSFDNITQLEDFVSLLQKYPNIKEIKVLYLYSKASAPENRAMLRRLNLEIGDSLLSGIIELLKTKKIIEIFSLPIINEKKSGMFIINDWYFDEVELYYNKEKRLLWHTRKPNVFIPGDDNYLDAPTQRKTITIHPEDVALFKTLIQESKSVFEYQIESCELKDFGDSKELIRQKKEWLQLINKYNLDK